MAAIEFTDNYQDLSTGNGFQFKFKCERCGDGFMSTYKTNPVGFVGSLLRSAGSVFGGSLGSAGNSAHEIQRAIGGAQHDGALRAAVDEIRPLFRKCRRCGDWMCAQTCWNTPKDMCKRCAPVGEEEETAMRAGHVQAQVANDLFLEENRRMSEKAKEAAAKCSACGAATLGQKFCPGCGAQVSVSVAAFCGECGNKLAPGARFCGGCGKPVPASG